ncbi:MAG: hypothetical protein B6U95_00095 [Thermofilum sp. ex4484_82]|nr:MAG: hypothetical protein B6U95_00095 [Thermofilum sp. ex4484_82]OYT40130.1 MAG: hypothetical protein B6U96_00095 [Archaeoglobales archaeon ex4484_92]
MKEVDKMVRKIGTDIRDSERYVKLGMLVSRFIKERKHLSKVFDFDIGVWSGGNVYVECFEKNGEEYLKFEGKEKFRDVFKRREIVVEGEPRKYFNVLSEILVRCGSVNPSLSTFKSIKEISAISTFYAYIRKLNIVGSFEEKRRKGMFLEDPYTYTTRFFIMELEDDAYNFKRKLIDGSVKFNKKLFREKFDFFTSMCFLTGDCSYLSSLERFSHLNAHDEDFLKCFFGNKISRIFIRPQGVKWREIKEFEELLEVFREGIKINKVGERSPIPFVCLMDEVWLRERKEAVKILVEKLDLSREVAEVLLEVLIFSVVTNRFSFTFFFEKFAGKLLPEQVYQHLMYLSSRGVLSSAKKKYEEILFEIKFKPPEVSSSLKDFVLNAVKILKQIMIKS